MYLFDANIFIEAKNRYYAFDIVPAFWSWLDRVVEDDVRTIAPVRDELIDGKHELADWFKARRNDPWILSVDDTPTQEAFSRIATELALSDFKPAGVAKFLSGADPWLIAKAETTGAVIVTHEVLMPDAKKKVPIPNLCASRRVRYMNTFDALRAKAACF